MKFFIIILFNFFLLFSGTETKLSIAPQFEVVKDCMDAEYAQEAQSFYSKNPGSQIRNKVEIWESGIFVPVMKRD